MTVHAESETILFDFKSANSTTAWQVVNDDVMGGVSAGLFRWTNGLAEFRGEVSLENNGGFTSVRSLPLRHDLAGRDTLVIGVRGDGRRYKFTVRMSQSFVSPIYQSPFTTRPGEWGEHRFAMNEFVATFRGRVLTNEPPLEAARITSVGFLISDKQEGPFRLEVAWIKAIRAGH